MYIWHFQLWENVLYLSRMTRRKRCYALILRQIVDLEVCLAERSLEIDVLIWVKAASLH